MITSNTIVPKSLLLKWFREHRTFWTVLAGVTAETLAIATFLYWAWTSYYSWDRDHWNQDKIMTAYVSYYAHNKSFPKGLSDLVSAGYLPEKAPWHREPPGFFARSVDYRSGSYVVGRPRLGDVKACNMLGRKIQRNGRNEIDYDGVSNCGIRDQILLLQGKPLPWLQFEGMEKLQLSPTTNNHRIK